MAFQSSNSPVRRLWLLSLRGRTSALLSRTVLVSSPATPPVVPGSSVALEVIAGDPLVVMVVSPILGNFYALVVERVVFPPAVMVFLPALST